MILLIGYIWFNFWAILSGIKEGILYSKKGADAFKWDEHELYATERVVVFLLVPLGMNLSIAEVAVLGIACFCAFSFWHNGSYYETRNRIDVPSYSFYSSSKDSTAKLELSFKYRLFGKIFSLALITTYLILK
jgi:hypothetical protein